MGYESPLLLEFNVSESVYNAVLSYESDHAGQGREAGKTITKNHFIYCRTTPTMTTYFYKGDDLMGFVKGTLDPNAARGVLYLKEGFDARMVVKKEVEARIETRSLWLCCCTCGLILCRFCCCCPGRTKEIDVGKLNDDYYCEQLKERFPDKTISVSYEFHSRTGA